MTTTAEERYTALHEDMGCKGCYFCDARWLNKATCCTFPGKVLVKADGGCKVRKGKYVCPRCGGDGGEPASNFEPGCNPLAWHPCYHCGATGRVSYDPNAWDAEFEAEMVDGRDDPAPPWAAPAPVDDNADDCPF